VQLNLPVRRRRRAGVKPDVQGVIRRPPRDRFLGAFEATSRSRRSPRCRRITVGVCHMIVTVTDVPLVGLICQCSTTCYDSGLERIEITTAPGPP
jgi:hypothetical protein